MLRPNGPGGRRGDGLIRPDAPDRRASGENGNRPRVLVVDDDDAICELLRDALTADGYAVATVPHGAAALELVRHHRPEVILVDLRMPIMDGWAFVEQYRRTASPPAAIVLLTATRDAEESGRRLGADGVIRKPFELAEVTAAVQRCLSGA